MMKCTKTAGYTWADYKTNAQTAKEINITSVLDKLQEYRRNLLQCINKMPWIIKNYRPEGRRNQGRPLKRLPDISDWNGLTGGPTAR
jgi:hypothetical protein